VGKQDQYLASFGGFVVMDIEKNGTVKVEQLKLEGSVARDLQKKSLMFYTFKKHDTVKILEEQGQKASVSGSDVEKAMLKIKDIGRQLLDEFRQGKISNFGKLMHEHWLTKKTISSQMSDPWLDEVYNQALQSGAEGGKIMGSGGGGCFLFFVPEKQQDFISKMEKQGLAQVYYKFEMEGAKVIYE
jgi:D-glycero-alpha-D-manno-heptose-7-phosphate kinase